ncbi:MAG: glycosyltransferase, partial [Candidatus Marinimicrobia bacterium]|nr:glycosyltransferase [Candidatus Neomarinimicrobiota bacterium]
MDEHDYVKNRVDIGDVINRINNYDGVIIADYDKGFLLEEDIESIIDVCDNVFLNTKKKFLVIFRGINTDYFDPSTTLEKDEDELFKLWELKVGKKIILFPARMTSWKGQLDFIDVIKKMDTQNILVLFAGDTKNSSYTNLVKDKIDKNHLTNICKILGSVNQDEMRSLYQIADLSVSFPLRAE